MKIVSAPPNYGRRTVGRTTNLLGRHVGMSKIGRDDGVRIRGRRGRRG